MIFLRQRSSSCFHRYPSLCVSAKKLKQAICNTANTCSKHERKPNNISCTWHCTHQRRTHVPKDQSLAFASIVWRIMCDMYSCHRLFITKLTRSACFDRTYVDFLFAWSLPVFFNHRWSTCLMILITLIEHGIVLSLTPARSTVTRSANPYTNDAKSFNPKAERDRRIIRSVTSSIELWEIYRMRPSLPQTVLPVLRYDRFTKATIHWK